MSFPRFDKNNFFIASLSGNTKFLDKILKYTNIVNRLLMDKRVDPSAQNNRAIHEAYMNKVKILIKDERVDPSIMNNQILFLALNKPDFELTKKLIKDPRVDPSSRNNRCIHTWISLICC